MSREFRLNSGELLDLGEDHSLTYCHLTNTYKLGCRDKDKPSRRKLGDLLYEITDPDFRILDDTFYAWDKGDCSELGMLLVLYKYIYLEKIKDGYYLMSYPQHEEIYNYLFGDDDRKFIG